MGDFQARGMGYGQGPAARSRRGMGYGRPPPAWRSRGMGYGLQVAAGMALGMGYGDSLYPLQGAKHHAQRAPTR